MLHTILLIIATIGIVILCIVGIIILIIAGLLFIPFRYKVGGDILIPQTEEGEKSTQVYNGNIKVWWLLHIIYFQLGFEKSDLKYSLKIFGKTVKTNIKKKKNKKNKNNKNKKKNKNVNIKKKSNLESYNVITNESKDTDEEKNIEENTVKNTIENVESGNNIASYYEINAAEPITDSVTSEKKLYNEKKSTRKIKIKQFVKKLKDIKMIKKDILEFINNNENKETINFLKNNLFKLIKHIRPRKIKADIKYGTGDPAITGQILALIAVFFGVTGQGCNVFPDFEKKFLDAKGYFSGRFYAIVVLIIAFKIYRNKKIKKMIQQFRRK